MVKNKKLGRIPDNLSITEGSVFWDEHSIFEFEGSEEVKIEFKLKKKHYVGIDSNLYKKLETRAQQLKLNPETLLENWITEKTKPI